jgi:hypothetical protein
MTRTVVSMGRARLLGYAAGLVACPLLLAVYWLLNPAYGDLQAADIAVDIGGAPGRTRVADMFAFTAVFLAVPGTLAYLRLLTARAPVVGRIGCWLAVVGWVAVLPLLVMDVVAGELSASPDMFEAIYDSTPMVLLSAIATLHVVGGVLIGVALVRTRLVPRPLAVAAALAPVVHLASNLAGLLWVDIASWLVVAATGLAVLPGLARLVAADESLLRGEQGGPRPRPDPDLGVDVLHVP